MRADYVRLDSPTLPPARGAAMTLRRSRRPPLEALSRIDALFDVEREINSRPETYRPWNIARKRYGLAVGSADERETAGGR